MAFTEPDVDTATGHLLFSATETNTIIALFQIPHTYAEGTNVRPKVRWIKEASGVVVWQLEYKWYNISGSFPANYTTLTTSTVLTDYGAVSPAVNVHTVSYFADIDGTSMSISSMLECKVSRLGADGSDTYAQAARYVEFNVEYLRLGHGSETTTAKRFAASDIAGA